MVGYSGWNAATYVAEELKQPERTLPAALAIGTGLVTALYVGLNMVFIYSTPVQAMKGVVAVGKLAAENLFLDQTKERRRAEFERLRATAGACTPGTGFDNVENALRGRTQHVL